MPRPKGASVSLLDHPDFQDWLRATYSIYLDEQPELALGDCEGCGGSGVPVLAHQCLVCLSVDFGMSIGERRIADALRASLRVFVEEPPEAGHRLVSQVMFALAQATHDGARGGSDDERHDDEQAQ